MKEVKAPKMVKKQKINSKFIPHPERFISATELELMELKAKKKQKVNKKVIITGIIAGLLLAWAITMTVLFIKEYKFNDELLLEKYDLQDEIRTTKNELGAVRTELGETKTNKQNVEGKYNICLDTAVELDKVLGETESIMIDLWNYWYEGYPRTTSGDYFKARIENVQKQYQNIFGGNL